MISGGITKIKFKKCFIDLQIKFHEEHKDVYHSYWMCSILVNEPEQRDKLRDFLEKKGILYRTHGGASKQSLYTFERNIDEKESLQVEQKKKIACKL